MKDLANLEIQKENKMGTKPIGRLLLEISLPMCLSMLVYACYNIVDSIFVSRIGEEALTAVSIAFSIQNLMVAVAVGTGVGINSLISKRLGERCFKEANEAAMNGLFLALCSTAVFTILGFFITPIYFKTQTQDALILKLGCDYLKIVMIFSFGLFFEITAGRILLSTGKTFYSMIAQIIGSFINIILDPLLIFGIGIFPKMGIIGAAIATVIGQIVGLFFALFFILTIDHEIKLSLKGFRPSYSVIAKIYKVGLPSILLASIGSVMVYFFNLILKAFSDTAVAFLGIYFKLQSFVLLPVLGLNNGIVAIVAYNYGAKKAERILETIKIGVIVGFICTAVGFIIIEAIPNLILLPFKPTQNMQQIAIAGMRIIATHFLLASISITFSSVFQALGNGLLSMIISFVRQLVVLIPIAYLLSLTKNINMVWLSFPFAEIFSLALSCFFMVYSYKKYIKGLKS